MPSRTSSCTPQGPKVGRLLTNRPGFISTSSKSSLGVNAGITRLAGVAACQPNPSSSSLPALPLPLPLIPRPTLGLHTHRPQPSPCLVCQTVVRVPRIHHEYVAVLRRLLHHRCVSYGIGVDTNYKPYDKVAVHLCPPAPRGPQCLTAGKIVVLGQRGSVGRRWGCLRGRQQGMQGVSGMQVACPTRCW